MSTLKVNTVEFGIEVADEFVAAYGPTSILQIQRALREQTNLSATQRNNVINFCVRNLWDNYDGMTGIYWMRGTKEIADIEFDFLINDVSEA